MNPPLANRPKQRQPAGAEKYDEGALNMMQQIKTNEKKVIHLLIVLNADFLMYILLKHNLDRISSQFSQNYYFVVKLSILV